MANPIILTVDDDIQVCNAIERDLRQHYRQDYRIMKATSGAVALETVQRLKQRNDQMALFLVDQRVPGIFAVGDIRQGAIRRVASAMGEGSTGVSFVHQYLKTV